MKHATLHLLVGLACLSAVSIAAAAPPTNSPAPAGPVDFDHGIPVFELPTVVVTPGGDDRTQPLVAREAEAGEAVSPAHDTPAQPREAPHAEPGATGYTAMRVVER